MDDINPFEVGRSLSEFMRTEGLNQYQLAEVFDLSQGAIQKMLAAEQKEDDDDKKRHFIVYEDAVAKPRKFALMEWKVIHRGIDLWEV